MVGNWMSWGLSRRGATHVRLGIPCQDAWFSCHARWGDLAVVCDGMGSCREARRGAQAACRAVVTAARRFAVQDGACPEDLLGRIYAQWRLFLLPFPPRDCRTTCLFALRSRGRMLFAQLGDGMLVACGNGRASPVFPDSDKDFVNITTGLGERFLPEQWQLLSLPEAEVDAVLLTTDGLADDIEEDMKGEFALDILAEARMMRATSRAAWLREILDSWTATGPSDDKTIVCLYLNEEAADVL